MKVLLAVDGSEYTMRMLRYISGHGDLLESSNQYMLFTAVTRVPSHASRFIGRQDLRTYYQEQADLVFRAIREFTEQHGWKYREIHSVGHASAAIIAIADVEKPDLIVMGTHGHSTLGNVLLGSVSREVLAGCQVPVLLVR